MKNTHGLDVKLQALFHFTSSILHRSRWFSTAIFEHREAPPSGTYRIELWVNYPSIIEQIRSKAK